MKSFNASFEAGIAENRHNMLKRRFIKMIFFFTKNRFLFSFSSDLPGSSNKTALTTSAEKPLDDEDDNVPAVANEVTETKHNNKSEPDTTQKKQAVSNADTDRKKNGIAEARENYKFDVRLSSLCL